MVNIKIGTAGWEYKDWKGPFYPRRLNREEHLSYYASIFEINEINSTFYNLPTIDTIRNWHERVPDDFRFLVKVWREITHRIHEEELESKVLTFFNHFQLLEEKILGYLFQFPPWFKYSEKNLEKLEYLIRLIPEDNLYFLEFRDGSWFETDRLSEVITGDSINLVSSYIEGLRAVYYQDQSYYYIRLIGDRSINVFNRIQRSQTEIIDEIRNHIDHLKKKSNIKQIFIIVNNHFSGFAPETANELKKAFDLPVQTFSTQTSLNDFF